jgi:hypothetical protein
LEEHRTIFVTEGKDSGTVEKFVTELEEKSGKKENIELAGMDMFPAFISVVINH